MHRAAIRPSNSANATLGFTLLELVLALLLTGVLATAAVSAYRTYAVRSEVAAGILAVEDLRNAVAVFYLRTRAVPRSLHDLRDAHGRPIAQIGPGLGVSLADGRLDLTYGASAHGAIAGRVLALTPHETAGLEIVWTCGNRIPGAGLQPLGFSAGGRQAVQTASTIEARYLPRECR